MEYLIGLVIIVALCFIIGHISDIVENARYMRSHPIDSVNKEVTQINKEVIQKKKELEEISTEISKRKSSIDQEVSKYKESLDSLTYRYRVRKEQLDTLELTLIEKQEKLDKIDQEIEYRWKCSEKEIKERIRLIEKKYKARYDREILSELKKIDSYYQNAVTRIDDIIRQKATAFPHIASIMSDMLTSHYEKSAQLLETKKRPALEEAKRIRELRQEVKPILKELKLAQYRLKYLEILFPNIVDLFDADANDSEPFELETDETTDRTRYYLSQEEYSELSTRERNQLALDRYISGRKSKWQIGRDYEMYIGQEFEQRGFDVEYTGIIEKLEDMGRDLHASNLKTTYIVQCKNWSHEKTIHEKHIFQLYGTVVLKQLEHPQRKIQGMFVTSTSLSAKARQIAEYLSISVYEKIPLGNFPRIKCNISSDGTKIYHLPFDQQYESTIIEKSKGEFYALTVDQAEDSGFRRALRHYNQ